MTARDWLAKRAELEAAASEGPWEAPEAILGVAATTVFGPERTHALYHTGDHGTAAWVADARTTAPAMRKALEAVLAIHHQRPWEALKDSMYFGQAEFPDQCDHCRRAYPCTTVDALTAALGGES